MRAVGDEIEQGWEEDVCRLLQGLWLSFCVNWRVSLEQKSDKTTLAAVWRVD